MSRGAAEVVVGVGVQGWTGTGLRTGGSGWEEGARARKAGHQQGAGEPESQEHWLVYWAEDSGRFLSSRGL